MTVPMTTRLQSFLDEMKKGPEPAEWGFEALLERPNFAEYFGHLKQAGLFDPSRNPGPLPVEGGYVRFTFWPALPYLKKCAELAGAESDQALAIQILNVLESVTSAIDANNGEPDNYHTFQTFAEILGLLPLNMVEMKHVDMARIWLASKYDRGMVSIALDRGLMRRLLDSADPADGTKADRLFELCTEIKWEDDTSFGRTEKKPASVVEDHWLRQFLSNNAAKLGAKRGLPSATTLLARNREIFSNKDWAETTLWRPAVEDHGQNHDWRKAENRVVEGLRDVLLSWADSDSDGAAKFIEAMLKGDLAIGHRIALYVVNEKWRVLEGCFRIIANSRFFTYENIHELYGLLNDRFASLSPESKAAVVKAIRDIQPQKEDGESQKYLKRLQVRYLTAISGKGSDDADAWLKELQQGGVLGGLPDHPDFNAVSYIRSGFGPSALTPEEIVSLARQDLLVQRLNDFRETSTWDGPSVRSLADSVSAAVASDFTLFIEKLPNFLKARRAYQFGVLNGFMKLWRDAERRPPLSDWAPAWAALVLFFENIVSQEDFWNEEVSEDSERLTPTRDWIPGLIAEFIELGTKRDEDAYDPALLPRTRKIVETLLEKTELTKEPTDDPVSQAINWPRGKAIEALINHALRECRLADKNGGGHTKVWEVLVPIFDNELSKCVNNNFEFSTLAGMYISNLFYLSADWVQARLEKLFPKAHPNNLRCAASGLAYARATRQTYLLLSKAELVQPILDATKPDTTEREKFIERIGLAYIWGDVTLDSPIFKKLFQEKRLDDLRILTDFFWSVSSEKPEDAQKERILQYWRHSVDWTLTLDPKPSQLIAHLARLVCYLESLSDADGNRLLQVSVHLGGDAYHQTEFFEELARLAPNYAKLVASALEQIAEHRFHFNDYEGHLKRALESIAEHGEREAAIRLADRMRDMRGMPELYAQLTK